MTSVLDMVMEKKGKKLYSFLKKNRLISTLVKALCFLTGTMKILFELFLYANYFCVFY